VFSGSKAWSVFLADSGDFEGSERHAAPNPQIAKELAAQAKPEAREAKG
jgi:hypothetical protein